MLRFRAAPVGVGAGLAGGVLLALWSRWLWRDDDCLRRWLPLAFLMMGGWAAAAASGGVWNAERYADQALAEEAARLFPTGQPVFVLGVSPTVFAWTMRRDIRSVQTPDTLARELRSGVEVGVITTPGLAAALERELAAQVLETQTTSAAYRLLRLPARDAP